MASLKLNFRIRCLFAFFCCFGGYSVSAEELLMPLQTQAINQVQTSLNQNTQAQWLLHTTQESQLALADSLRMKAVKSDLPNAAQIPGATLRRWATLGFINDIEVVSEYDRWGQKLPQTVKDAISFRDKVYAIPTQIHRSNWMWVNNQVLDRVDGEAPRTWLAFKRLTDRLKQSKTPIVITAKDPAQNTLVLEALMLGLEGPDFYRQAFIELDFATLKSEQMIRVFHQLAELRPHLTRQQYETWEEAAQAFERGQGAVMFAGDWIKKHLSSEAEHIHCEPLPEASATFLFNLHSVVLFRHTDQTQQSELARALFTESLQTDLNLSQGSIPARVDISPWGFDQCGVRAMREFRSAHRIETLQHSLASGMAASEAIQRNVFTAVNEFINNPNMTPKQGAKALAKAVRVAVYKL